MTEPEQSTVIARAESAYQQIATYFERQIWSGRLRPGQRMPTSAEIARQFDVTPNTVQKGFELLAACGLVERKRKSGTFVSPGVMTKTAGIVFDKTIFTELNSRFFSVVLMELQREFSAAQWATRFYCTMGSENRDQVIGELESDLRGGKIRAIVEFCVFYKISNWIRGEAPVAWMPLPEIDEIGLIVKGLEYLAGAGYRRPAVLFKGAEPEPGKDLVVAAEKAVDRLGLHREEHSLARAAQTDHAGYGAAKALFALPSERRPDSLLIANDNACRGVIYAALESGIAIPAQLGLITHRNRGIEIFSPVPLTCLEVDPAVYAKVLVESGLAKIEARGDGERRPRVVSAELVIGESCGERLTRK